MVCALQQKALRRRFARVFRFLGHPRNVDEILDRIVAVNDNAAPDSISGQPVWLQTHDMNPTGYSRVVCRGLPTPKICRMKEMFVCVLFCCCPCLGGAFKSVVKTSCFAIDVFDINPITCGCSCGCVKQARDLDVVCERLDMLSVSAPACASVPHEGGTRTTKLQLWTSPLEKPQNLFPKPHRTLKFHAFSYCTCAGLTNPMLRTHGCQLRAATTSTSPPA